MLSGSFMILLFLVLQVLNASQSPTESSTAIQTSSHTSPLSNGFIGNILFFLVSSSLQKLFNMSRFDKFTAMLMLFGVYKIFKEIRDISRDRNSGAV